MGSMQQHGLPRELASLRMLEASLGYDVCTSDMNAADSCRSQHLWNAEFLSQGWECVFTSSTG